MSKQEVEPGVKVLKCLIEPVLHLPDTDGEDDNAGVVQHPLHHQVLSHSPESIKYKVIKIQLLLLNHDPGHQNIPDKILDTVQECVRSTDCVTARRCLASSTSLPG